MCIWKVEESERHCEFCTFAKCEARSTEETLNDRARRYIRAMSEVIGLDILAKDRRRVCVVARQVLMYHMHEKEGYSWQLIARFIDVERPTVIYSAKKAAFMLANPRVYPVECEIYEKFLGRVFKNYKKDEEQVLKVVVSSC